MNIYTVVARLTKIGISMHIDAKGAMKYRAKPGAMTDGVMGIIGEHRAAIIAHLQADPFLRPLTDEEKRRIDEVFQNLRDQHGHALVEAGWHREVVFDGLDPTQCEKAGDVPGVIGLLMSSGRLVKIHPDQLDLEFPDGVPFS